MKRIQFEIRKQKGSSFMSNMSKNNDFKMKSVLIALAFGFALTLSVLLNLSVSGAETNAAAGSADDPLLTLSYLTKVYTPQLSQTIDKAIADRLKEVNVASGNASSAYIVLELTKGQKLRAKSGALELIMRPGGTASVVSEYKTQGIADLTIGDELLNGKNLPVNHSLLIPRADERGILITSVNAYVLVRGDYEIY